MFAAARLVLDAELAAWRRLGRRPTLWWRDDDACEPTPALDRLLAAADGLPLCIAVVPDRDLRPLAAALSGHGNVTVSQHGLDHRNQRDPGQPVSEHRLGATAQEIGAKVRMGRERLIAAGLAPAFYTPPWNRIDEALPEALAANGYSGISSWGAWEARAGPLERMDAHVDVLRWNPSPRFRGAGRLYLDLADQLRARRRAGRLDAVTGILTHHLVHDEATWNFLADFGPWSRARFEWRTFGRAEGS